MNKTEFTSRQHKPWRKLFKLNFNTGLIVLSTRRRSSYPIPPYLERHEIARLLLDQERLALSKGPNRAGASLPSPADGNRPIFRNVVFSSYLEFLAMDKVHKPSNSEPKTLLLQIGCKIPLGVTAAVAVSSALTEDVEALVGLNAGRLGWCCFRATFALSCGLSRKSERQQADNLTAICDPIV
jgi:hypothetical protein